MSILGKLLIVFNLLAAGAFAYLTLENWKLRQDLTWAATSNYLVVDGLPVEPNATPPANLDANLDADRVAFPYTTPNGQMYESIPKSRLESQITKGGEKYGGEVVADQTAEVVRLQKKVAAILADEATARPDSYFAWIRTYLLSIARTGANRDGILGLFALSVKANEKLPRDAGREQAARRDLAYLGRTSSQISALQALIEIAELGNPQEITPDTARDSRIKATRGAVSKFLLGEVGHGVKSDAEKVEAERKLKNAVVAATSDRAGGAQKQELIAAATGDAAGWTLLANVAVEPLADKASADRAIQNLFEFVQLKTLTATEKAALAGIKDLIQPPALGADVNKTVETVALNVLNSKFDEAAMPAATKTTATGNPAGEKARKIAHLLYHIDGWRYAVPADKEDRKAWHERVVRIIGMPAYIRAAEAQASEFAEASQRLITVITEEQGRFEAEYQAYQQRVLTLYAQWLVLDTQLKAQDAITTENDRLRAERETERDTLKTNLALAQEEAKVSLAKLQATQGRLFAIQRDLRDAQAAILALEKQLRFIELGPDYKRDTDTKTTRVPN